MAVRYEMLAKSTNISTKYWMRPPTTRSDTEGLAPRSGGAIEATLMWPRKKRPMKMKTISSVCGWRPNDRGRSERHGVRMVVAAFVQRPNRVMREQERATRSGHNGSCAHRLNVGPLHAQLQVLAELHDFCRRTFRTVLQLFVTANHAVAAAVARGDGHREDDLDQSE
jgi:hypothetical protein